MFRPNLAILFAFGIVTAAMAQESTMPRSLVGFLPPGTHLGIRGTNPTDFVNIRIYTDSDFAIAVDARELTLDELVAKYEAVGTARDEYLKRYVAAGGDGDAKVALAPDRGEFLCTVSHVGEDYILVTYGKDETTRRAYRTHRIVAIDWGANRLFAFSGQSDRTR